MGVQVSGQNSGGSFWKLKEAAGGAKPKSQDSAGLGGRVGGTSLFGPNQVGGAGAWTGAAGGAGAAPPGEWRHAGTSVEPSRCRDSGFKLVGRAANTVRPGPCKRRQQAAFQQLAAAEGRWEVCVCVSGGGFGSGPGDTTDSRGPARKPSPGDFEQAR